MENEIQLMNKDGQVLVSSRVVAQDFAKGHKDVLKSIRNLMAKNCAVKNMFFESNYISSRGREEIEYLMNRDGFSLLVMGFTGSEALQWKLKYIEAFNKMEQLIKEQQLQLSHKQQLQLAILNGGEMEKILALKEYEEVITKPLKDKIEQDAPKVEFAEAIQVADTNISIGAFSKNTKLGRNRLFEFLRDNKILFYDDGNNVPY